MKPQNPDKKYIRSPACRKDSCTASPDAGNHRSQENDELRWAERHVPADVLKSRGNPR